MKKYLLEIAVFLCGAIVMVYEIVGSRMVAPHFGTSIFVWTSLIGIILASLSIGYWLGGKIADKKPTYANLAWIILFAAILIGFTTFIKEDVLGFILYLFDGMIMRTLWGTIILFAPASILMGMVSPYAVRLKLKNINTSGSTVGNLYAISTVGSIFGTFLSGFFLIPYLGTTNILYLISAILVLVSLSLYFNFRKKANILVSVLVLAGAGLGAYAFHSEDKSMIEVDTRYNHVQIFDMNYWISGEPIKVMKVNDEYSSAMFPDNDSLVYEYSWFYRLAEHFKPDFSRTLILGGAAYSYPKFYLLKYPHASIDVVEIDPGLTELAKEHFRLKENPRMRIFHEDGRTYLNKSAEKYDVILGDAYKSLLAIPFQLTTKEAIQLKYDMLTEDGIVIENLIASIEGPASEFMKAEYATYKEVFPQLYFFACHDPDDPELLQSISMIALKSDKIPEFHNADPELNDYLLHRIYPDFSSDAMILTDDFAPVEYFALKAL
jgi:spermidine synthase